MPGSALSPGDTAVEQIKPLPSWTDLTVSKFLINKYVVSTERGAFKKTKIKTDSSEGATDRIQGVSEIKRGKFTLLFHSFHEISHFSSIINVGSTSCSTGNAVTFSPAEIRLFPITLQRLQTF